MEYAGIAVFFLIKSLYFLDKKNFFNNLTQTLVSFLNLWHRMKFYICIIRYIFNIFTTLTRIHKRRAITNYTFKTLVIALLIKSSFVHKN